MTDPAAPRLLTKSRFTLARECPTKLYYTGKPDRYVNTRDADEFLKALATGGFQVGELAKVMHPGGIEVTASSHDDQVEETRRLLERDSVTIFEAAFRHGDLFVRVDILRKQGSQLELVEVKAKSFDSSDPYALRGKRGGIKSEMRPYLEDVAFQAHVVRHARPDLVVQPFLMLVDKAARSSVDGLHQRFRIHHGNGRPVVRTVPGTDATTIGTPILARVEVGDLVDEILRASLAVPGATGELAHLVGQWAAAYRTDTRIPPVIGKHCAACEFRAPAVAGGLRSGFHECWMEGTGLTEQDLAKGTVLDLANFRGKQGLIDRGALRLVDVSRDDLGHSEVAEGQPLTDGQRQWMQVSADWPGGGTFYLDRELVRQEMATWEYPLHFIDFETTRVAIPFYAGERPYSSVAFQFSVHTVGVDGRVTHHAEFLSTSPGARPNYEFVRQLRAALGSSGTVFMWSTYENTILRGVLEELAADSAPPADAEDLKAFITSLLRDGGAGGGTRAMVDLCRIAQQAFFHPATRGSSSIKKVLPAVLGASDYLRERYSGPVYGAAGGIPSRNYSDWVWWRDGGDGMPVDPYGLLPAVFSDIPRERIEALELDADGQLAEGGAAMVAFGRLQYDDIPQEERASIEAALRRYCELDTLAMVMIYEAWREWCK